MNSNRVSVPGNGGALTSIPSMPTNHRFSLTHWCTICSCTLRPRGSPARGRTGRSSSRNSLHTLTTFIRSVSYVSTRKSYLINAILPRDCAGSSLSGWFSRRISVRVSRGRLFAVLERFVRIRRRLGNRPWVLPDLLLQILQRGIELRVISLKRSMRKIVHDNIRVHTVPFDEPLPFGPIDSSFRRRSDSAVRQPIARRQPDLASPGAHADHSSQSQPAKALGKRLAVRSRLLVAKHHDVPAISILHVGIGIADARLPPEPRRPQQLPQQPGIDVAALIVAHVNDQALAVEHRVKLPRPLLDVPGSHRAQMNVS